MAFELPPNNHYRCSNCGEKTDCCQDEVPDARGCRSHRYMVHRWEMIADGHEVDTSRGGGE